MRMRAVVSLTVFALVLFRVSSAEATEIIALRSGNGPGPDDSLITFLPGPYNDPFDHALTPADFSAARAGDPAAFTLVNPEWAEVLPADPAALWIATDLESGLAGTPPHNSALGRTALFALDFNVASPFVDSAQLTIHFLVDNQLGDSLNEGIFINGQPVSSTKRLGTLSSYFTSQQVFVRDVTSLVSPGLNTLYLNQVDLGFGSRIEFSASLSINGSRSRSPRPVC